MPRSITFSIGQRLARRAARAGRTSVRVALIWIAAVGFVVGGQVTLGKLAFDKLDCMTATAPLRGH